jgi:DNA-binding GntR family transcriptional regulator
MESPADRLLAQVRERILSGRLSPDAPVRQDALAQELGVSKIPLREALSKLETEGLVTAHRNRGFVVRPMSRAEAEDLFDLRLRLEPGATVAGASGAGETDRAAAEQALRRLEAALEDGSDDLGRSNRAFHLALIRPAARPVTLQVIERLLMLSERYVRLHLTPRGRPDQARREHRDLLAAWAEGDAERVGAIAEAHIRATLADLLGELAEGRR